MSYKPDEKQWMAYLYGEMEEHEKEAFETYLFEHEDARAELEKWQNLRRLMEHAEDKEVIAPPLFVGGNVSGARAVSRSLWNAPYVKTVLSVAASVLILLLAARFTGVRVSVSNHEFRIAFGEDKPATPQVPTALSREQVQEMINSSLTQQNSLMQASLEETQRKLDASIRKNLAASSGKIDKLLREAAAASQQQISAYVANIREENMQQVKDYFQLTSTEQKKYIENLLVDFAKYLQQQRNNDLQMVQTQMKSLEQNTNLFRQETEQILSSIITTVGNPVPDEVKN